jgi:hypothetical protein
VEFQHSAGSPTRAVENTGDQVTLRRRSVTYRAEHFP